MRSFTKLRNVFLLQFEGLKKKKKICKLVFCCFGIGEREEGEKFLALSATNQPTKKINKQNDMNSAKCVQIPWIARYKWKNQQLLRNYKSINSSCCYVINTRAMSRNQDSRPSKESEKKQGKQYQPESNEQIFSETTKSEAQSHQRQSPKITENVSSSSSSETRIVAQRTGPTTALSRFVVVKEKTEETVSFLYILGMTFLGVYVFYLISTSLLSSGGEQRIQTQTFNLVKSDDRVNFSSPSPFHLHFLYVIYIYIYIYVYTYMHVYIEKGILKEKLSFSATFRDEVGEHVQVVYYVHGSKGEARIDVDMVKTNKEWEIFYCIVNAPFSVITIVDNRRGFV
ncbi:hypothetical protein RFI_15861, partial [Reticulomyxa filosa]